MDSLSCRETVDDSFHPEVTAVVICYNHERFVVSALESVKAQSYKNLQIIIIDDCSSDKSTSVISRWIHENSIDATFLIHQKNIGLCRTINQALELATGEYFAIISADDVWNECKVAEHIKAFASLPDDFCVVYSDANHIDDTGIILRQSHLEVILGCSAPPSGNVLMPLLERNFIPAIGATMRTSALREVGGYDERLRYEDYDMWLRLAKTKRFFYVPKIAASWRILSTSLTHTELIKHSPEASYTDFLISEKCLTLKSLNNDQRQTWSRRQWEAAYWLYAASDSRAPRCLWKSFINTKSLRTFILIFFYFLKKQN